MRHPLGHGVQYLLLLRIDRPVAGLRNGQEEIAVLGHDISEALDNLFGRLVAFVVQPRDIVEPVADAGVGLPRLVPQMIGKSALDILHHGETRIRLQLLARQHDIDVAMPLDRSIIIVGRRLQPHRAEGKLMIVHIDEVGLIFVDQVGLAQQPASDIGRIILGPGFDPLAIMRVMPAVHRLDRVDAIGQHGMAAGIELLRIEPLPPLALAVALAQAKGVVALALSRADRIIAIGRLIPVPRMGGMVGHAELHAGPPRRLLPDADHILLRPHTQAVPGVVAAVIAVEIVMMAGKRHEIARAGFLITGDQRIGVPPLRGPQILDVLHPRDRRMAVGLAMMVIHGVALHIHEAAIPVALLRHRLRPPMRPEPQLGVAEPVGMAIMADQRIPCRANRPGGRAHRTRPPRRAG